jgi:hypothetical protein
LGLEPAREFGRRRCLARSVQAYDENAARLCEVKRRGISAKQRRKLVVEDLYDLLARGDTTHNLLAQRLFLDASNKVLCDAEVDIRFQQCHAHFAQRIRDILLTDAPMSAKVFEDLLKFVGEP